MIMKINWGVGIGIFYSLFVVVMVGMVVWSSGRDLNMVQENYYDHDLAYESFRKSRENANKSDVVFVDHKKGGEDLIIRFVDKPGPVIGTIKLYRPSNNHLDKQYPIKLDGANTMHVPVQALEKGYWKVLISWESEGMSYYKEEMLIL